MNITRRNFFRGGCAVLCCALLPAPFGQTAEPGYYRVNRGRLLAEFSGVCQGVSQMTAGRLGAPQARQAADEARQAFAALLADLADLGGESNRNQTYLTQAAWLAALHKALKPRGMSAADTGRLFYDLAAMDLRATAPETLRANCEERFSRAGRDSLAQWAAWSQQRIYPGDWVGRAYFDGGQDYDVGYDMLECGAVKLFAGLGMMDAAPYFCLNDFPRSLAEGSGLMRSGTLAQGRPCCDFRYKKGRAVTQNWDTEAPRIAAP